MGSLQTGSRRLGTASMELVLATAVALPIAGAVLFLGFKICSYVYSAIGGLLTMPFVWVMPWPN